MANRKYAQGVDFIVKSLHAILHADRRTYRYLERFGCRPLLSKSLELRWCDSSTHTRFRQNKGLSWACDQFAITFPRARSVTLELATDISSVTTSPYVFMVVRMSACLIIFCCWAAIAVPTASSQLR